jgi:hypothetical protein
MFAARIKSRLLHITVMIGSGCAMLNAQDNPPRFEIGAVLSTARQTSGNYFHAGGGGRFTVNATRYIAGEVELTRQPTGNSYSGSETHAAMALKGTYRVEQRRWLKFAGLNFFGVVEPAFVNRSVDIADPNQPPSCYRCIAQRRETTSVLDYGGGLEVVPTRAVAIRFDATHASFRELPAYFSSTVAESRTYLKIAVMLRVP